MAIKTATPELHKRIMAAASKIGRGVNHKDPDVELQGRKESAVAHIENQILLGRQYLTADDLFRLTHLLHGVMNDDLDDADDYTADAVETNAEALRPKQPTPDDYDEDLEGDED